MINIRQIKLNRRAIKKIRRLQRLHRRRMVIRSSRYDWIFFAPSPDARMWLRRPVWRRIALQLPRWYAIPDREFISFVRIAAGLSAK
jgi:hypothetical protein